MAKLSDRGSGTWVVEEHAEMRDLYRCEAIHFNNRPIGIAVADGSNFTKEDTASFVGYLENLCSDGIEAMHSYYRLFPSVDAMLNDVSNSTKDISLAAAIVFDHRTSSALEYTVLLNGRSPSSWSGDYNSDDPATVQYLVEAWIPTLFANTSALDLLLSVTRYPTMRYDGNEFFNGGEELTLILMVSTFLSAFTSIVCHLVHEKETRVVESLRIAGLQNRSYWIASFLSFFLQYLAIAIVSSFLLTHYLFTLHSVGVVFLLLSEFLCSVIAIAFLFSLFFSNTKLAAYVGSFAYNALVFSSFALMEIAADQKRLLCLNPISAFMEASRLLYLAQKNGQSITFGNLAHGSFDLHTYFTMVLVDIVYVSVLIWYLEKVLPSQYGSRHAPWFPFQRSYWFPKHMSSLVYHAIPEEVDMERGEVESHFFEQVPQHDDQGRSIAPQVILENLGKTFSTNRGPVTAVDNVSLELYEGQCFVLLGHNGAGKTTLLSMLSGILAPSRGRAEMYGCDVQTGMEEIRQHIGFCPQHSTIVKGLTVAEHVALFGAMKGMTSAQVKAALLRVLADLELQSKAHAQASTLSGGMKRKLSLVLAFLGDTKVVFCDEPSAGMDAYARRSAWDLIRKYKKGRVIILTTHLLDEADLLGDRIAFMTEGQVQCCGSPLFLKEAFGVGYTLTVATTACCDTARLHNIVFGVVKEAKLEHHTMEECVFSAPLSSATYFPTLFAALEKNKSDFGIASFGASIGTLETVFIKADSAVGSAARSAALKQLVSYDQFEKPLASRPGFLRRLAALVAKRMRLTWHDRWRVFVHKTLSLVFLIAITVRLVYFSGSGRNGTLLPIDTRLVPEQIPLNLPYAASEPWLLEELAVLPEQLNPTVFAPESAGIYTNDSSLKDALFYGRASSRSSFGAVFFATGDQVTLLINGSASSPSQGVLINAFTTALARQSTKLPQLTSRVSWGTLPFTAGHKGASTLTNAIISSVIVTVSFSSIISSFGIVPVYERRNGTKHAQLMAGAGVIDYWLSHFIVDVLLCLAPIGMALGILYGGGYLNGVLISTTVVLLLFAAAAVPHVYLLSQLFSEPSQALNLIGFIELILFVAATVTFFFTKGLPCYKYLKWILYTFPTFNLGSALIDIQLQHGNVSSSMGDSNLSIKALAVSTGLFLALLVLLDMYRYTPYLWVSNWTKCRIPVASAPQEDQGVAEERQRVKAGVSHGITIDHFHKTYSSMCEKTVDAVCDLSLAVHQGECFGFLGSNGAGKSTTMDTLMGKLAATAGTMYVNGMDINRNTAHGRLIGYCPQFDSLFDTLTVSEHLLLYAALRGVPSEHCTPLAASFIRLLHLDLYADRQAGTLSGGNKRKLSVAMAMIGNPPILCLDEPSNGVDPVSRRQLWNILNHDIASKNRAIVLTTHSMEETEALCSRIGIMVDGKMQCIGSSQQLKSRYGNAHVLDMQTRRVDEARALIQGRFPGSFIAEAQLFNIKAHIPVQGPNGAVSLADVFEFALSHKEQLQIDAFGASQSTLEHIFIQFASNALAM